MESAKKKADFLTAQNIERVRPGQPSSNPAPEKPKARVRASPASKKPGALKKPMPSAEEDDDGGDVVLPPARSWRGPRDNREGNPLLAIVRASTQKKVSFVWIKIEIILGCFRIDSKEILKTKFVAFLLKEIKMVKIQNW